MSSHSVSVLSPANQTTGLNDAVVLTDLYGHPLPLMSASQHNVHSNDTHTEHTEVALLIVMATVGMIGNFAILMVILVISSLRKASNAFLFHHCLLDFVKSAFCLPFAQSLIGDVPPLMCSVMGSTYIVCVTTSSFNLLALVMNEAYHFSDKVLSINDSRNYSCVIFGVFMIWFSSIIMNLGVAFIPGNPSFDRESSNCVFIYGITRNYVLHCLWIVLVTMGLACTYVYIRMLHLDIKRSSYYSMTTLIKATVSIDISVRTDTQRQMLAKRQKRYARSMQQHTRKKLYLLTTLVTIFVLFWYPLFCVTISDPTFRVSVPVYRILTIIAWMNPAITPIIVFFIIKVPTACVSDKAILNDGHTNSDTEQSIPFNSSHANDLNSTDYPVMDSIEHEAVINNYDREPQARNNHNYQVPQEYDRYNHGHNHPHSAPHTPPRVPINHPQGHDTIPRAQPNKKPVSLWI